ASRVAHVAVLVQQAREYEFRRVFGQSRDINLHDIAFWKTTLDFSDVLLQAANNDFVTMLDGDRHTAAEPLGIENFEERRKAVGMGVMGGCGQEQQMFESRSKLENRASNLRHDRIFLAARRRRLMRFILGET